MTLGDGTITMAVLQTTARRQQETGLAFRPVFSAALKTAFRIEQPSMQDIEDAVLQAEASIAAHQMKAGEPVNHDGFE